jgi:hypothetical protein
MARAAEPEAAEPEAAEPEAAEPEAAEPEAAEPEAAEPEAAEPELGPHCGRRTTPMCVEERAGAEQPTLMPIGRSGWWHPRRRDEGSLSVACDMFQTESLLSVQATERGEQVRWTMPRLLPVHGGPDGVHHDGEEVLGELFGGGLARCSDALEEFEGGPAGSRVGVLRFAILAPPLQRPTPPDSS